MEVAGGSTAMDSPATTTTSMSSEKMVNGVNGPSKPSCISGSNTFTRSSVKKGLDRPAEEATALANGFAFGQPSLQNGGPPLPSEPKVTVLTFELEPDAPVQESSEAPGGSESRASDGRALNGVAEEDLRELRGTISASKMEEAKDPIMKFNINSSLLITDSDSLEYKSYFSLTQENSFPREVKISSTSEASSPLTSQGTTDDSTSSKDAPSITASLPVYKKVASDIVENILTTVTSTLSSKVQPEEKHDVVPEEAPKGEGDASPSAKENLAQDNTPVSSLDGSQPKETEKKEQNINKEIPVIVGSSFKSNKMSSIKAMFESSRESYFTSQQEATLETQVIESVEQNRNVDEKVSEVNTNLVQQESSEETNLNSNVSKDKSEVGEFILYSEEIDKERRRIIENQVVRIKPQETWKGAADYQEQKEDDSPPEQVDCVLRSTLQQSLASYKERKSQQTNISQDISVQPDAPTHDEQVDGEIVKDLVDSDSILEKKEQLKKFWEHKMMSEKSNKAANKTWVAANNDHNLSAQNGDVKMNGHITEDTLTAGQAVQNFSKEEKQADQAMAEKSVFKSELEVGSLNGFKEKPLENGHKDTEEESASLSLSQDTGILNDQPPSMNSSSTVNDTSLSAESKSEQLSDFSSLDSSNDKIIIEEKPPEPKPEPPSGDPHPHSEPRQIATISTWKKEDDENIEPITIVGQELAKTNHVHKPTSRETSLKSGAESMIAQEIRLLKEREEELRRMREKMGTFEKQTVPVPSTKAEVDIPKVSGHHHDAHRPSPGVTVQKQTLDETQRQMKMQRTVSLDCLHGTSYGYGHRRKAITVKPLADNDEKPNYWTTNETPVEREIRLAKEREENLRREREMLNKSLSNGHTKEPQKVNSFQFITQQKEPSKSTTQRMLATSRIQQEIEEQTRKEMDLRDAGHIKTISHDRTTGMNSPLSELIGSTSFRPQTEPSPRSPSPEFNGRSSSSSTNSSSSMPPVRRVQPPQTKAVSMKRFIASRGKELSFSTFSLPAKAKPDPVSSPVRNVPLIPPTNYEMKPPQVRKDSAVRKNVSAESKIKDELNFMKAREEELKQQRMRLLGKSHPNLAMMNGDGQKEEALPRDDVDGARIVGDSPKENGIAQFGGPRKRSSLIAKWEQRIQQTGGEPINA